MKKVSAFLLVLSLLFVGSVTVGAENKVSEEKLDKFLFKSGATQELVNRWDYDQKLDLYNQGKNHKIEFDTTNSKKFVKDPVTEELVEQKSGDFTTFGTISSSRLQVSHDIWSKWIGGVKHKTVYANYSWNYAESGGTQGDKIAIAVPSGWETRVGSYRCYESQSGWPSNGYTASGDCYGSTYDLNFYGAVWNLSRSQSVWHKGWVSLDMKRISSSAQLKVLGKYVRDTGNSTTWTIGWGPMAVAIHGNKTNDQVAWDSAFTY